jgi:hypothetical protein
MPTNVKRSPKRPAKTKAQPKLAPGAKTSLATVVSASLADAKLMSAANKKRALALLDFIARRITRMTEDFHEIGKALKELLEHRLYLPLGYTSFEAMLDAQGLIGATQARKLIQVASRVPVKTALKVGIEKAFALTKFTDATPELDTPELLVEQGGVIAGKPAAEVSRRDIDAETQKLRRKAAAKKGKVDPAQREAEAVAKRGSVWLKARGAKKGKVEARRTKEGHVITITLSMEAAAALFHAT